MKKIVIDGVEYALTPVKSPQTASDSPSEAKKDEMLKDYGIKTEEKGVKKAVPTVSEYREKFKKKKLSLADVRKNKPNPRSFSQADGELDKFTHQGNRLFFGEGVSEDF